MPSKNGERTIDRVLSAVFAQKTRYSYEVIVVDSGSEDKTLDIIRKHPARLVRIAPHEFSHSKTRNFGASFSKAGKYIIFLNQDAVPADGSWLNDMVRSIEFEEGIKAACATELNEKAEYFNVSGVASMAFRNSATRGVCIIEPHVLSKYKSLPAERHRELFPFTTVCAIFDRKHFEKFPFDENVPWGEDLHWAVHNSNRGFRSACSSFARVYHHHDYTRREMEEIDAHTAKLLKELFNVSGDSPKRTAPGRLVDFFRRWF
jgi:rhamnosyltransferase